MFDRFVQNVVPSTRIDFQLNIFVNDRLVLGEEAHRQLPRLQELLKHLAHLLKEYHRKYTYIAKMNE